MSVTADMLRGTHWMSGSHSIVGAILVFSHPAGFKLYIGALPMHPFAKALLLGEWSTLPEETADALYIANFGTRVTDRRICVAFFPGVTSWAES